MAVVVDLRPKASASKMRSRDRRKYRALLYAAQGGICAHCEEPMPAEWAQNAPDMPTIEHVEARCRGGGNALSNLLLKHKACNEAGGNRPPSQRDRKWQAVVAEFLASRKAA